MRASIALLASALVAIVSATQCSDHAVFETCLTSTQGEVTAYCTNPTDYTCLCQRYTAVLNCYNSCPNDPGLSGAQSTKDTYCANASIYGSTSVSSAYSAAATTAYTASTTAGAGVDGGAVRTASGSSTSSSAGATKTNAAVREGAGVGVMFAAGAAALFL